jgi:hypothetical protein
MMGHGYNNPIMRLIQGQELQTFCAGDEFVRHLISFLRNLIALSLFSCLATAMFRDIRQIAYKGAEKKSQYE